MNLLLAEDDAVARMTSYFLLITATGGKKRRSEVQFSHGYCPECYEKHVRPQIEGR